MNSTVLVPLITTGVMATGFQADELNRSQASSRKPLGNTGQLSFTVPDFMDCICKRGAGALVTVMVCRQVLVFPHSSTATQVRVAMDVLLVRLVTELSTLTVAAPQVSLAEG